MIRSSTFVSFAGLLSTLLVTRVSCQSSLPYTCSSNVYCKGPLLHDVQLAKIYKDSKSFVDLRMINSESETLKAYEGFVANNSNPSKDDWLSFVEQYFEEGKELMNWTLPNFNPDPPILSKIKDQKFKQFAKDLVGIWPSLARKVSPEVAENPERYSLINVPNGFIVPGGRFKEIYYWDSFWIIEGLILSDLADTARGMIENLMHLVKLLGHVPNGSRVYYAQRSQPPLLTGMVAKYIQATKNLTWLRDHISILEDELTFWMQNRTVVVEKGGKNYTLLRYYAPSLGPRPESYSEDYRLGLGIDSDERLQEFYTDLKSAAESGWDFSSRWFINSNGTNAGNLSDVHTQRIVPVDLNAIYASALETLGNLHNLLSVKNRNSRKWWMLAEEWRNAIDAVLWDEQEGVWHDYDTGLKIPRRYFHPSNVAPLWKKCVEKDKLAIYGPKVIKYLKESTALDYPGGIPTSVNLTGEQWDLPNAWPPLQSMVVQALETIDSPESKKIARDLAEKWVRSNYKGFVEHEEMFEKYDAYIPGAIGGGGEYVVQSGFGWSNGVVLEFLDQYGDVIESQDS